MTRREVWIAIAVLGAAGLATSIIAAVCSNDWGGFWLSIGTELSGAAVVYVLLNQFVETREKTKEEKVRPIQEMGSRVHDVAIVAAEKLWGHGWLQDGSLQGAHLSGANLAHATLVRANLQGTSLWTPNLYGADLF